MKMSAPPNLQWLFGRRSIRAFRRGEVSDDQVQTLLEAAMAAPSAVAKDPWRFIVIRDRTILEELSNNLSNGVMLRKASLGVVVAGDIECAHDRQLSYLLQDCSASIQNLLLAAHVIGLGACWLGVHPRQPRMELVTRLLGLPVEIIPVACIAIGHPTEVKEPRTRFSSAKVHHDRWATSKRT